MDKWTLATNLKLLSSSGNVKNSWKNDYFSIICNYFNLRVNVLSAINWFIYLLLLWICIKMIDYYFWMINLLCIYSLYRYHAGSILLIPFGLFKFENIRSQWFELSFLFYFKKPTFIYDPMRQLVNRRWWQLAYVKNQRAPTLYINVQMFNFVETISLKNCSSYQFSLGRFQLFSRSATLWH